LARSSPISGRTEIERVKRKRPENLDAYDLVMRALPHADTALPEEARIALPLLERALALEPSHALTYADLAWCYESLFMRGGRAQEAAVAAVRHARAAIAFGRDDAFVLGLGGFLMAMVGPDRATRIEAIEAALTLSPSCSTALIFGSITMGWSDEPERAIEWGERAVRLSPFDPRIFIAHIGIMRETGINQKAICAGAGRVSDAAIKVNPAHTYGR
jgi:adenylate cyclase